ncbi:hypothetical protein [Miltoncostaea marina]|uniref:hypothetical protein n=1 Tax=Miltoncostaea marina TaxID=2843215 RepID=UPI001C3C529A|nr:hypothetical protein [Miltoncostaea marina]
MRTRLLGGLGVVALRLVVVAALAVTTLRSLDARTGHTIDRCIEPLGLVGRSTTLIQDDRALSALHLHVHDGDPAAQDEIAEEIAANTEEIREISDALSALPLDQSSRDALAATGEILAPCIEIGRAAVERSRAERSPVRRTAARRAGSSPGRCSPSSPGSTRGSTTSRPR